MTRVDDNKNEDPVLIDLRLPVVTPRLLIRAVAPGDGAAMHDAKRETWDAISRWMIWTRDGPGTAEADEALARRKHAAMILREDVMLVAEERATGRPVVWTGFHNPDWRHRHFTTGYWVRQSAQGQGYATESGNAILRYLFGALGAKRVDIGHADGNGASRRVIEKLGYVPEGVRGRAHELPDGRCVDLHVYARLSADGLPPLDVRWG